MPETLSISIVIPTYNESASLPDTLHCLSRAAAPLEIIVVDAGSSDQTRSLAEEAGARVLDSPVRQRAAQMNLGASAAKGDILLFLHADTCLPCNALDSISTCMSQLEFAGGAFFRRFDHPSLFLKFTCLLADWRLRLFGWSLGDQGVFVKKTRFQKIGGFPEWDIFEDLEFSRRLVKSGKAAALGPPIITSGRRFGDNPIRRTIKDLILTWKYLRKSKPLKNSRVE